MQQPRERRSRIRRTLRNLTSRLRPMPRHIDTPAPPNPSDPLLPLPQPQTSVTSKHAHGPPVPQLPHATPMQLFQQHDDQPLVPLPPHTHRLHNPALHPLPETPSLNLPTLASEHLVRRPRLPHSNMSIPSIQPQVFHPREYVPEQIHNQPMYSDHNIHPQYMSINPQPRVQHQMRINPPQPRPQPHQIRINPQPRLQPHQMRINPSQSRPQPDPMRAPPDFARASSHSSHPAFHSLPRQALDMGDPTEGMVVEPSNRRAWMFLQPLQQASGSPSMGAFAQPHRRPERMDVDTPPPVRRVPGGIGMRNVDDLLSVGMQRSQHPPGVMPPSYPFMNNLPTRQYPSQRSIPVSNMPLPRSETISQRPESSQFPDSLLQSSIPPHQLARLYERLQRSTTTTRPPPPSTPKPVQSGKSRRGQRQRAQKSPRSRASRILKSDHILRMLTLSQAPSHWFGSLEISHTINGTSDVITVPVGAFLYSLTNKPAFTASLPDSIKLDTDTATKFDEHVVNAAAGGEFMVRVSPVNDYGHTVGNAAYADLVNTCMAGSLVHSVRINPGTLFLFPVTFPQVGLALVGIFVSN